MRSVARLVMTVLLMVVLGSGFRWLYLNRDQLMANESALPSEAEIASLWTTTLFDHSGKAYPLAQYRGKPVILNFWATWCEPCREEMPEISALAIAHPEIAVLGLAIDEAAAVHEFTESTPVSYPLLIAENEGMPLAEALGNHKGVLPYTVVISAQGEVTQIFFGRVNREMLQKALNL
jgi:thiol-disulfide isomerase/thioredoxin